MFSDPRLQRTPDVGGLNYLPSDYGDGLGLLDSNSSCLYTDWLNSEQEVGRTNPSLPGIIEGGGVQQDDFWNDLLLNTPTASQLPQLKVKVADSSVNNGLFNDAPFQAHAGHEVSFHDNLDMFSVGMIPHGGAVIERRGNEAASSHTIFGMQSFHEQSKDLQPAPVMSSSFEQFDNTVGILEDDEANFIITRGAIDGASTEESTPRSNSLLNPLIKDENKSTWKTTATEKAARQDHAKRSSAEVKRTQDQYVSEHQPLPAAPASTTGKARNSHSNSASQTAKESRWAEQLLSSCASAIASRNIVRTQHLMWVLNDLASLAGDANQRLAAYGLKALFTKITGSASTAYQQRHPAASITPKSINRALLKFHEVNPLHQFVYTLTNALLIEFLEAKPRLHVIDIGVSQGTQWPTFIEAMATRSCGTPELLRLTIVDDPQGTPFRSCPTQGDDPSAALKIKLERFAKVIGINLQLQIITIPLEELTPEALSLKSDETLAICAQFRLHRLMETATDGADDDSPGGSNATARQQCPRDRFLQLLRDLSPELIVLNDNDVDELASDFLARFNTVTDHHWRFLDSMSASFKGRDCEERQAIEQELAMALLNSVACEGRARVERNDSHAGWCVRMRALGFRGRPPSDDAVEAVRVLLRKYDSNWDFLLDHNCSVLQWKQQPMTFCSVWT